MKITFLVSELGFTAVFFKMLDPLKDLQPFVEK